MSQHDLSKLYEVDAYLLADEVQYGLDAGLYGVYIGSTRATAYCCTGGLGMLSTSRRSIVSICETKFPLKNLHPLLE